MITSALFTARHARTTDVDISSVRFWGQPFDARDQAFARLRHEAPVSWHPPLEVPFPHDQGGFWAVTRAADITEASRSPEVFGSRYGVGLEPVPYDPAVAGSFLSMDAPEHRKHRGLISAAFTPKAVHRISARIEQSAARIVDGLIGRGEIDFVRDFSSQLPMETVSDIVGVPESERANVARAAENMIGAGDAVDVPPAEYAEFATGQAAYLFTIGMSLAAHRRSHPGDDLMTNLVQAEIDGERLTDTDIGQFMVLMAIAGNDTTKQTTTHTALALDAHPDQREWLTADFDNRIGGAVDEFVRHATPVMQFARTALADVELAGVRISAGDKVGLFYCSGNRDETVFEDPAVFDLSRPRSPHVGFGGGGPHYCLGNGVARTQLRALFKELLTRVPHIEFGSPVPIPGHFINGVSALPAHVG
jgi:cytochrome P450